MRLGIQGHFNAHKFIASYQFAQIGIQAGGLGQYTSPEEGVSFDVDSWFPQNVVLDLFGYLLNDLGSTTIHLFTNNFTVNQDTELDDLIEADYDGYLPLQINYSGPVGSPFTLETITFDDAVWFGPLTGDPVYVYGFYLTYNKLGVEKLWTAGNFAPLIVPFLLSSSDDELDIFLNITMLDCIHE